MYAADACVQAPRNGLALVCFRHVGWSDARNHELMETLSDSGKMFLVHTKLEGREILRFCVGSPRTTEADIDAALAAICGEAQRMRERGEQQDKDNKE